MHTGPYPMGIQPVKPLGTITHQIHDTYQIGDLRTLNPEPVAKSFHTTISQDWTDQEALEGQRLVALQEKSEITTTLIERETASLAKFKQSFLQV